MTPRVAHAALVALILFAALAGTTFNASSGASSPSKSLSVNGAYLMDRSSGSQIDKAFPVNFNARLASLDNDVHTDAFRSMGSMDAAHTLSYDVVSLDPNAVLTAVPEPATGLLVMGGALGLALARRKRV